jgi:Na+-driven multidrug efflux pump
MQASNKIVFNTGILYLRMFITIGISLYSTRLILTALGSSDYGLFSVVAGVIGLLSFISITLSTSTQRYISFSLGKGNHIETRKTFANSILLHILIGVIMFACFEIIGFFFIDKILNIDTDRLHDAKILFHFVVLTSFFTIVSVPLDALNNAHENMLFIASISVLESLLRLILAIYLSYTSFDKLITYGCSLAIITLIILVIKIIYCNKKYDEYTIKLKKYFNKNILKNLVSFSGWNLFGVMSYSFKNQGIVLVLNIFFGVIVNAAYGIANQLSGQLSFFATAMRQAMQPQIVKSEGEGNRNRSVFLSVQASKYSFILYSIVAIPFFVEAPFFLKIWLGRFPDNTILFCRLIILLTFFIQLRVGIISSVHAIGHIKSYQLISTPLELLTLPVGYIYLYWGYPAYSILIVSLIIEILTLLVNMIFFKRMTGYPIIKYIQNTFLYTSTPLIISSILIVLVYNFVTSFEYLRVISILLVSILIYPCLIYIMTLNSVEKDGIKRIVFSIYNKIAKK